MAVDGSRYPRHMADTPAPQAKQPPQQHAAVTREAPEIAKRLAGLAEELVLAAAARVASEADAPQGAAAAGLYYEVRKQLHELLRRRGRVALDDYLAERREAGVSERRATGEVQGMTGLGRYGAMSAFGPRWERGSGERGDRRDLG